METTVTLQTSGGATQSGSMRLPPSTESFTYDNRGNLTSDGLWDYGWDAQNRLIWAQSRAWTAQSRRLDLIYDGLGRRIQRVLKVNGGVVENTIYVYDGWLLLAELNGLNNQALLRSYGWGLDLSGTMRGAGGVGGLLWVYNSSNGQVHDAVCDGQGNVTGLIEGSTGQISARYEYSPFGEVIRQTGPMAQPNPFRFSTKYTDNETELVYYGYRYYSPTMGRCLSRDPIGELGGANLYEFVYNQPMLHIDTEGRFVGVSIGVATTGGSASTFGAGTSLTLTVNGSAASSTIAAGSALALGGVAAAEAATAGLVAYDAYQVYEIHNLNQENAQAEAHYQQEEQLLLELQEDRRRDPKVYTKIAETQDSETCCKFIWDVTLRGRSKVHNAYTSRLFHPNYEIIVIAPDGDAKNFDSGETFPKPVTHVYEAKTGRRWVNLVPRSQWSSKMNNIYTRDLEQFTDQQRVAKKCKLSYSIFFQDLNGFNGYRAKVPQFAPHSKHQP